MFSLVSPKLPFGERKSDSAAERNGNFEKSCKKCERAMVQKERVKPE